ncbi:DUF6906 family protein [Rossellomorea vietnamensis]|uniref:DUF6906 family protein n=1 Tax=Rossellomorea vietnamensis TaxID=218284 RepID=UPI003D9EFD6C
MKQGKKPTRNQRKTIIEAGVNPNNWYVSKDLKQEGRMLLVHKNTNQAKEILQ